MAITLETFRSFATQQRNLGDDQNVFASGADKAGLSAKYDVGNRPLDARDVKLTQAQDNVYVRSQLLSAVRDALGGEGDCVFRNLQARLFGITAAHPGADAEIAAKPLTMREVRAALDAVDIRLRQREVARQFNAKIDESFASPGVSAGNRELFRRVLTKVLTDAQNVVHDVSLEPLTRDGSAFAFLKGLVDGGHSSGVAVKLAILAQSLPAEQVLPFLKACALFGPAADACGLSLRLHAAMDQIAALPAKKFTPADLFKIVYPACKWPRGIDKNVTGISTIAERDLLASAIDSESLLSRSFRERIAAALMLGLGMTAEDAKRVLADPISFKWSMLPPSAMFSGTISAASGVNHAFGQMMADLDRSHAMIEIKGDNGRWTASPAASLKYHPLHELAAAELRGKLDALFGANATDVQKANVMLFMSQNAQVIDGVFTSLLGLSDGTPASGIKYVVNAEPDGSVVVQRGGCFEHNRFTFEVGVRFCPDGSQRLESLPMVQVHEEVAAEAVNRQVETQQRELNANANREFADFVQRHCGLDLVAFFEKEIADIQATYADVNLTPEDFRAWVDDALGYYLSNPDNDQLTKDIMAMSGEALAAKLAELKPVLTDRVNVLAAWRALGAQAERQAAEQIHDRAAQNYDPKDIDVERLHARIARFEHDCRKRFVEMSVEEVKAQIDTLRGAFVDERCQVLDAVRTHADGIGDLFRNSLLTDAVCYSRRSHDDVMFMIDTAYRLPAMAAAANGDERAFLKRIGEGVADRFIARDAMRHGDEEGNDLETDFVMYRLILRQNDFQSRLWEGNSDQAFLDRLRTVNYHHINKLYHLDHIYPDHVLW